MSIVPAKACVSTMIRFSPELHQRLKDSAARNGRSLNTEMNVLLEAALGVSHGGGIAADLQILREVTERIQAHVAGEGK